MKQFIYLFIILNNITLIGQVNYSGFIDKYPIELSTDINTSGNSYGVYVYTTHDEPIILEGNFEKGELTLFEKNIKGLKSASMTFEKFNPESDKINGIWEDLKTGKKLIINLSKKADIAEGIIQNNCIDDKYFRIVTDYENVSEIKIFQKKSDKMIQKIDVDCRFMGLNSISIGDFNFDGITDFSIFESSYAGPNTSSLYFLYNPKTKKYFESGFSGTSLEFDQKTKRITETNQCCAGSSVTTAEYKVVKKQNGLRKRTLF
ncbi:XAC2610-related protein [Flavobacterium sp.]|uniref:XAC2610-related protein n=1 Tax=Flavobacterium sp. TaxID=239 RepID=UPI003751026F